MRVFIAGSTGVLGRAAIRQACERGHSVVALVRDQDKARVVRQLGAEPLVGDIFDQEFLRGAVRGSEVILHLATAIPKKARARPADWIMNDRLRREGTRNLLAAGRGAELYAYVQQSIAFLYGDLRGEWIAEDARPRPNAMTQSALDGERLVLDACEEFGFPGVVLRGATFYGPEAWSTRALINAVKRRQFPIVGRGDQYWHYVYVEDMARACVLAAEHPLPGEVFFVADDWPFHARDFVNHLAARLHAPAAFHLSLTLARLLLGPTADWLAQSARYRTGKIKKMLGWAPRYPTYREGLAEILPQFGVPAQA